MKYELGLHRLLLSMLVALLSLFIALLWVMDRSVADERVEVSAALLIVIAVATVFTYLGTAEGLVAFFFGLKHPRELVSYLALGLLSIASGLYLAASQEESLQIVALIVAPHAFLFGLAELRIANNISHHPKQRRALIVCGAIEIVLGLALVRCYWLPAREVTSILGFVALLTVFQLLPLIFYQASPQETEVYVR